MRALEITIFIVLLSASIGFLNAMNAFDNPYVESDSSQYSMWSVSNLSSFDNQNPSILDQAGMLLNFAIMAITWVITIVLTIIVIFPTLVNTFHIPMALSALLQVGVWMVYVIGIVQWQRGASVEGLR